METLEGGEIRMLAGIDVGGTKIAVGLVDASGHVVRREDTPIYVSRGPDEATERILAILRRQMEGTGLKVTGVGIGCTGPVDPITGEVGDVNTLPGWQGWKPCEALSAEMQVTAAMENDADAALLGEARVGAGKGARNLICVTVGTGIGVGLLIEGRIYRGAGHSHPEIGHHVIEASGPLCSCGAYGCWEALAAGPAMEQWFAQESGGQGALDARAICALARSGDSTATRAVQRTAGYLGTGLANIISIFMPETIVLGGSVFDSADLFLPEIRRVVAQNCRLVPHELCAISLASLGRDLGLIGAAQVWHHRFGNAEGIA
ncbi:MAG TPA: ROK family protein [Acidobacteriaceae bacterium]|jgi:glucokinase|nr:ROK family protein [Acidobacteriaceae bacterium]